ncbi:MAG: hypothetical protein JW862_02605 [Anaerolineales bacterium]|nr:hypothetical protein [Anaerolineales bacterium]
MRNRVTIFLFLILLMMALPGSAQAQDYYFQLEENNVDVYWNADGTLSLYYTMVFNNDPAGHPIEFVDLAMPNRNFVESSISAEIGGQPVEYIRASEYQGTGVGVAIALGSNSISSGQRGTLNVYVGVIRDVLYFDDDDPNYASAVFAPAYFQSNITKGNTSMLINFHLPPGVQPEEPRWHSSPGNGWPEEPQTSLDAEGRVLYTWYNPEARPDRSYNFGASFPKVYVPEPAVADKSTYQPINSYSPGSGLSEDLVGFLICGGFGAFMVAMVVLGVVTERKRKMQYLPPKIRIEGHGIKRGLTAVEAAILMEQPMDKVLTMILFSVVKKDAARVLQRDPLKLEVAEPIPEKLRSYETDFLTAFQEKNARARKSQLQKTMVDLIKSVGNKMKGFSHKETVAYYRQIMEKAWQQVEAADTPEVKSQKFDDHMGWTMLDRDFERRTQDVFRSGPVYVPIWWHNYDPGFGRSAGGALKGVGKAAPAATGGAASSGRSGTSLPTLPGADFAASVVTGVQGFAGNVVGSISDFTSGITGKTNPIPKSSSGGYRGGSGGSCACACACAGCACACAGGGR